MLKSAPKIQNNNLEYFDGLIQNIKQRPGMYLGQPSITRLRIFLMGYGMARGDLGISLTEQEKQFAGFQKWIEQKYQSNTTEGWHRIILSQVQDEKLALDLFFELLEEFQLDRKWPPNFFEETSGCLKDTSFEIDSEGVFDDLEKLKLSESEND
ncbi:MAG: hypothetical protein AB4290_13560 [Spirulina sp.]